MRDPVTVMRRRRVLALIDYFEERRDRARVHLSEGNELACNNLLRCWLGVDEMLELLHLAAEQLEAAAGAGPTTGTGGDPGSHGVGPGRPRRGRGVPPG